MYGQQDLVLLVLPNFPYIDKVAQCMDIKLHNAWTSSCTMHGHQVAQCNHNGHGQVAQCMDSLA